jgi:hypothetical protein
MRRVDCAPEIRECGVIDDETHGYHGEGEQLRILAVERNKAQPTYHGLQTDRLDEAVEDLREGMSRHFRPTHCTRIAIHT